MRPYKPFALTVTWSVRSFYHSNSDVTKRISITDREMKPPPLRIGAYPSRSSNTFAILVSLIDEVLLLFWHAGRSSRDIESVDEQGWLRGAKIGFANPDHHFPFFAKQQ